MQALISPTSAASQARVQQHVALLHVSGHLPLGCNMPVQVQAVRAGNSIESHRTTRPQLQHLGACFTAGCT